jgi:hypothetical protein
MVTMEHNLNPQFSMAHVTNLNLNNFKVIEAMELKKILQRGALECHYLRTKFHSILGSGSKFSEGTNRQAGRQAGRLVS